MEGGNRECAGVAFAVVAAVAADAAATVMLLLQQCCCRCRLAYPIAIINSKMRAAKSG